MVLTQIKSTVSKIMNPVYMMLVKIGIDPNHLTALGLAFAVIAGWAFASHAYGVAVVMIILTGLMDMLDGGVARAGGFTSDQGAFLDSVFDRLGEAAIYTGLILGFESQFDQLMGIILLATAFSVSYVRARGESLGISLAGIGIMERAERMMFLFIAALAGMIFEATAVSFVIYLLVVLTSITVVHRFYRAFRFLDPQIA